MKKTLKWSLAGAAVALGIYGGWKATPTASRYLLCHYKDSDIEEYVVDNLEEMISEQERVLGVQFKKKPAIEFRFPWEDRLDGTAMNALGSYNSGNNTIYLNSGLLSLPTPDDGDILAYNLTEGHVKSVVETLLHELGHYYCDLAAEEANIGNWPNFLSGMDQRDAIGMRLVSEGIAEYFERKMADNTCDHFSDRSWPQNIDGFFVEDDINKNVIYNGGFHLVKPIMEKYGSKAVLPLMILYPKGEEVLHLPEYQQVMLAVMEKLELEDLLQK